MLPARHAISERTGGLRFGHRCDRKAQWRKLSVRLTLCVSSARPSPQGATDPSVESEGGRTLLIQTKAFRESVASATEAQARGGSAHSRRSRSGDRKRLAVDRPAPPLNRSPGRIQELR